MTDIFCISPFLFIAAFIVDLLVGDPRNFPHPVRIIGKGITQVEKILRKNGEKKDYNSLKIKGILLLIIIAGTTFTLTLAVVWVLDRLSMVNPIMFILSLISLIWLASTTIANKELINSSFDVLKWLKDGKLERARESLSLIVGRDTANLNEKEIAKATIETLSENLSDGVIAPMFYLLIGGLPLAMLYKAVNTLDSMVGYRNERYLHFGWASARFDDFLNFIPARITGFIIAIAGALYCRSFIAFKNSLYIMFRDGRKHLSPNAGIPEAAMAGILGVRLGGPAFYGGVLVEKPYIGEELTADYFSAAFKGLKIIKFSSYISVFFFLPFIYLKELVGIC